MSGRLWYPQLDVYDCIRRLVALLAAYKNHPSLERLYIVDFYLANPPLLHYCSMTRAMRGNFLNLKISQPKKTFLTYPAPPLLFKMMESVQREAVRAMVGKKLLCIEKAKRGSGKLTQMGQQLFEAIIRENHSPSEMLLVRFLTTNFPAGDDNDIQKLRQRTGLRRPV